MEPESARAALGDDYPDWRIGRRGDLLNAWKPGTRPPLIIRDVSVGGLRKRLVKFHEVLAETESEIEAARAAEWLVT